MKKVLSSLLAIILVLSMTTMGFCAETTSTVGGGTVISTTVPENHKIKITYNDGGYVLVGGRICQSGTELKIDRFDGVDLQVICKKGYTIKKIFVNGEDVTNEFNNGTLKLYNVVNDVDILFDFVSSKDDDKKTKPIDIEGTVYLGKLALQDANLDFDFGGFSYKTNKNGRYKIKNIGEGRHFVTVLKNDKSVANFQFVIERGDVEKSIVEILPDGTKKVTIPLNENKAYIDFVIGDGDNDGNPDVNPDDTNPNLPPVTDLTDGKGPTTNNDDKLDDGVIIQIGEKEKTPIIPTLGAVIVAHPFLAPSIMAVSLFLLIFLIIFKKKKKDEKETTEQ